MHEYVVVNILIYVVNIIWSTASKEKANKRMKVPNQMNPWKKEKDKKQNTKYKTQLYVKHINICCVFGIRLP